MKKLTLLILSLIVLSIGVFADDDHDVKPVYNKLKPMKITGYAKVVNGNKNKAKNEAIINAKTKMLKKVVSAFITPASMKNNYAELNKEIYSDSDDYLKYVTVIDNSINIDKKKIMSVGIVASVNVEEICKELLEMDNLQLDIPVFVVKIGGFDILDESTISDFEKQFVNEINKGGLKGRTAKGLIIKQNLYDKNYYTSYLNACKDNNIKLFLAVEPLNSSKTTALGSILFSQDNASSVNLSIKPVNVKTGVVLDVMKGLTGSSQNLFTSAKHEAYKALNQCLENLYEDHMNEAEVLVLNAWVDVNAKL